MNVLHLFDCRSLSKLKLLLNITLIIGVFYLILFIKRKASEFNKREFEQLANDHAKAHIHSDYSIFFIESNYNRKEFTTKEMCAIESAAKSNPNALIQVYTFTARLNEKANAMLNLYPNIRIIHFEPGVIFKDTPLLQWWFNGAVLKSPHSFDHIADAFRIAALWKYGGIYSDLDTITLKSFKPLIDEGKNGVGYVFENYVDISNSLMIFQSNLEYIRYVMDEFAKNYDASIWDKNGPILIAQSILDYCDIDNIHRHLYPGFKTPQEKSVHFTRPPKPNQTLVYLDKSHKCHNLSIFPQSYFHPFSFHPERNLQFLYNAFVKDSARDESYWQAIQNSYSVHFYDKITYEHTTKPGDKSFYDELTSLYCTFTYSFVKEYDLYFDSNYKKYIFF